MISLKEHYKNSVVNELMNTLHLKSHMAVPKIIKVNSKLVKVYKNPILYMFFMLLY